jgi:cellulose biosynthesis protein BcsQ
VALEPVPATVPLVVVAHDDPATADALRHAVEAAAGFGVAVAQPGPAGLAAALATGPAVALVGCGLLADVPAGCDVPLLAVGDDDRPADLRAALQAGTTTVAVHLAAAWARWGSAPVLLADLAGGLAFRLDLAGAPGWSALAAAAGTPVDAAALAATVAEPWTGLAVLPLAGLADGTPEPTPEPWAVQELLEAARSAYRLVVCDLPAADGPAVHAALAQADALLAVGRCETAGIRGLQAALAAWAAAGRDPDAGGVVTGVRPQAPLAPREVRAVLGDRLWGLIPAAAPELAAAAEDGALLLDRHDLPAVQAMLTLANRVVPFAAVST